MNNHGKRHHLGVSHLVKTTIILSRRGTLELRVHWCSLVIQTVKASVQEFNIFYLFKYSWIIGIM